MSDSQPLIAMTPTAAFNWHGVLLLVFIAGVCVWLYKRCVVITIESNGRVTKRYVMPVPFELPARLRSGARRKRRAHERVRPLSRRQQQVLSRIYTCQEIAFGTMLYVLGLVLVGASVASVFNYLTTFNSGWPLPLTGVGLALIYWGVRTVVHRQKNNPFLDADWL